MDRPRHQSRSRFTTIAWAATVLGLLVLPPALSTGQDGAPASDPPATVTTPPEPPLDPPQGGGGDGAGGAAEPTQTEQPTTTAAPADASAVSAKQPEAKAAGSLTVSIGDNFYSPASVSIDVGDTVTWRNNGSAQHSATASDGSFDTGVFGPGGSRSHTFSKAGSFDYFCTVHGTAQSGSVTVGSGGGGGGGGGPSEAAATGSADAAGTSSSLPSTGSNPLPPMVVGLLLLLAGLALRFRSWFGPA